MSCQVIKNKAGKIIKVNDKNGQESQLFLDIAKLPHVDSLEQAVEIYDEILKANFKDSDRYTLPNSPEQALGLKQNSKEIIEAVEKYREANAEVTGTFMLTKEYARNNIEKLLKFTDIRIEEKKLEGLDNPFFYAYLKGEKDPFTSGKSLDFISYNIVDRPEFFESINKSVLKKAGLEEMPSRTKSDMIEHLLANYEAATSNAMSKNKIKYPSQGVDIENMELKDIYPVESNPHLYPKNSFGKVSSFPRLTGQSASLLFRGIHPDELAFIKENGFIQSNQSYNLGDEVTEGVTVYATNPRTALTYSSNFAPEGLRPTEGNPNYILMIENNPIENKAVTDVLDGYVKVKKEIPSNKIIAIYSVNEKGEVKNVSDDLLGDIFDASIQQVNSQPELAERLAPNGKPTNLNQEQYLLVRTPAFKEWFGDWQNDPKNASKVLDENGEPMVVYHGSTAYNEITEFKDAEDGFYFTDNLEVAQDYGQQIIKSFLNIKNPLVKDFKQERWENVFEEVIEAREENREKRNDGNILQNIIDPRQQDADLDIVANNYIINNPNQVKSATNNNGEYSTQNNNILYSLSEKKGFNENVDFIQENAQEYKKTNKIRSTASNPLYRLNKAFSKLIATAYDNSSKTSDDVKVRESYEAMVSETLDQYDFIISKGLKVKKHEGEKEPYSNSSEMLRDIRNNNTLTFLPNDVAFGTKSENTEGRIGLQDSGRTLEDGYKMTNSEVFRVVHDYFGHGILGNQFGPIGEENATLQHLDLYTNKAKDAVIFQTRGQNSWVNFSGINEKAKELQKESRQLKKEGKTEESKKVLAEANKMFTFAEPKDDILPNIYNFKKYETVRRIEEQEQIEQREDYLDPRGAYENNNLSEALRSSTNNSRSSRGINRRSLRGTKNIRIYELNVIAEYTLDSKIEQGIKKAFPKFQGNQKIYEITEGDTYRKMMIESLEKNPFKASVTVHSAEDFSKMRMFITEDGSIGITLTDEGFLGGAWSDPSFDKPNNLAQLLVLGIKEGATTAEAFHTVLPDMYSNYGLKATSRTAFVDEYRPMKENGALVDWDYNLYKKFNKGRPDVVFFIYDGGNRDTIEDRIGQFDTYDHYEVNNTVLGTYDEAESHMKVAYINRSNFEKGATNNKQQTEQFRGEQSSALLASLSIDEGSYSLESDGQNYQTYQEALENTTGKYINIISNGKVIAKLPTTQDETSTEGLINSLILDGIIKAEKYTYNGETFFEATGDDFNQQKMTLEFIKENARGRSLNTRVEVKDSLVKIVKVPEVSEKPNRQEQITDAIMNSFSNETIVKKEERIKEDNLRLNLFKLLNDMGISVTSLKGYQTKFRMKNGSTTTVDALADIANRLVAFKGVELADGTIDQNSINLDDLTEEVMHVIVETLPQEQIDELSEFIRASPEYQEHYKTYNEVYKGDQKLLEKEILGKIMKNLTLSKTEGRNKSFLAKLMDIIEQFFDRLNITNKHFEELRQLNNLVEKFVIQQTETLSFSDIQQANDIAKMYSLSDQVAAVTDKLSSNLSNLTEKTQFSSLKRQLNRDLKGKSDEVLAQTSENLIQSTNMLINSTEAALSTAKSQNKGLSSQNLTMLKDLVELEPLLKILEEGFRTRGDSEIKGRIKLIEKLRESSSKIRDLQAQNASVFSDQVKVLQDNTMSNLGIMESALANKSFEDAIKGEINDINFLFSFFGQLHHSSNPNLKLLSVGLHKMKRREDQLNGERLSKLTIFKDAKGFTREQTDSLHDKDGYIKSEYDEKRHLDDNDKVDFEVYNQFAKEPIATMEEYKVARREGNVSTDNFSEQDYGKYQIELEKRKLEVNEPRVNPRYHSDKFNLDGTEKEKLDRKGAYDRYERLNTQPETITSRRESSQARTAIINQNRREDGRVILTLEAKHELSSIAKKRKAEKSILSDITGLKKGLKFEEVQTDTNVPLKSGGFLALNIEGMDRLEALPAIKSYDLHRLDHDYLMNNENTKEKVNLKDHFEKLITDDTLTKEDKLNLLLYNMNVSLSQDFYDSMGEGNAISGEAIEKLNPQKSIEIRDLRRLTTQRSALLAVYRNTSSPMEIDKMHDTDMETVRQLTASIKKAKEGLEIPPRKGESVGVQSINTAYRNYLKSRNIKENSKSELEHLIDVAHSDTSGMTKMTQTFLKADKGYSLSESEQKRLDRYGKDTLFETQLEFARQNLQSYFTRFAPEGYKTIEERYNNNESVMDIFLNIDSNPYLDITIDSSLLNDSEVIKMETYSKMANESMTLEEFKIREQEGTLKKFNTKDQAKYEYDLFDNGYILNPNFNPNYKGGRVQPKKGKYENNEFKQMFGLDSKGVPTRNKDLFELRKIMLDLKEESFEFQDSKGTNIYRPVQISKTLTEKIRDVINIKSAFKDKWSSIVEIIKDTLAYRIDDLAYGEDNYKKSRLLPRFYTRDLEKESDVSTDHFMALVQLITKSNAYKARKEFLPEIEAIQNHIINNSKNNKGKDLKNVVSMTESYIDSVVYGKQEQLTKRVTLPGGYELDLAKLSRVFTKYVSIKNLGFSAPIALTGMTTGWITKKVEEFIGEKINAEASKLGSKDFKRMWREPALNSAKGKESDNSEFYIIMQTLGFYNPNEKARNAKFGPSQRLASKSAMAVHAIGDFPITGPTVLSILRDQKIVDGKRMNRLQYYQEKSREGVEKTKYKADWTNNTEFLIDHMDFTKGKFQWKNSVYKAMTKIEFSDLTEKQQKETYDKLELSMDFIKTYSSNMVSIIQSQIPQEMKLTAQRHAIGSMAMLHKGFASIILQNKFKDRTPNYETGQFEEGTYRTVGRLLGSMVTNPKLIGKEVRDFLKEPKRDDFMEKDSNGKLVLDELKYYEAQLDHELKVRNTGRVAKELGTLMAMGIIFSMLFAAMDDDDLEDYYLIGMSNYLLHRTLNESGTNLSVGILGDAWGTVKDPLGAHVSAVEVLKVWQLLDNEEIKQNKYKGLTVRQRYLTKNIVGVKSLYDMHDAETLNEVTKSYEMYNKEAMNIAQFSLYSLLNDKDTGLFKED